MCWRYGKGKVSISSLKSYTTSGLHSDCEHISGIPKGGKFFVRHLPLRAAHGNRCTDYGCGIPLSSRHQDPGKATKTWFQHQRHQRSKALATLSHFGIPLLGRPNRRASGIHTHFGALHVVQAPASATLSEVDHADPPKCGTDVGDGARQVCGTDNGTKVGSAHGILQAAGCGH